MLKIILILVLANYHRNLCVSVVKIFHAKTQRRKENILEYTICSSNAATEKHKKDLRLSAPSSFLCGKKYQRRKRKEKYPEKTQCKTLLPQWLKKHS